MSSNFDWVHESFLVKLMKRIHGDDAVGMASQLAYFFLLSLFPLLIFLVTLLPYLPISQNDILNAIGSFAPPESMKLIEDNLTEIMKGSRPLLSLGILGTIWSASNGLNAIIKAFNRAYDVPETRNYIVARFVSILLTLAMLFVFVIALMLPVFGKQIGLFLFDALGMSSEFLSVWFALRWVITLLIVLLVFTVLYWIAPNKRLKCLTVLPGAVFATFGLGIVSWGFSFYVEHYGNYANTYGSLGGIIVLMIWFYLSGIIIIIGGELNAMRSERNNPKCE
ncbi:YihY/virulence factor BrkB family protein [Peribacillus sp. FSL H8-0477]|uniref:YihY/virulence factor BrkB family protein n=1 Tax=Peribacillus sp. FSL H8-0477 TaxID=2921388 RepID=UPI0030F72B0B